MGALCRKLGFFIIHKIKVVEPYLSGVDKVLELR